MSKSTRFEMRVPWMLDEWMKQRAKDLGIPVSEYIKNLIKADKSVVGQPHFPDE